MERAENFIVKKLSVNERSTKMTAEGADSVDVAMNLRDKNFFLLSRAHLQFSHFTFLKISSKWNFNELHFRVGMRNSFFALIEEYVSKCGKANGGLYDIELLIVARESMGLLVIFFIMLIVVDSLPLG